MQLLKRNNVHIFGKGNQALIFGHGFGCDQNMWRYVTPAFLRNFKIVLFDHVGSGSSDLSAYNWIKYNTLEGYADDIIELCQELNLYSAVYVGHSVGAMIGILSAIKAPSHFEKLILVGPSPCYYNDGDYTGGFEYQDIQAMLTYMDQDYGGWANSFAPFIMGNPEEPSLGEELAASFCNTNAAIARHFAEVTFLSDNREDLPKLKTKSLILQCSHDMIAPEEVGHYVHQHITGSTLINLRATGHCPNLSAPLETIAAMEDFLLQ
ncbi:alpha/beta hydrolase [Pontibacter qinzhouensis]|uniref:Alpha/beta hydrolase n=1 Tax=Pontibacter qinzhouensis TaxID=2603253 RepID=A0A5C8ILS8_9BACT|nr:alpha/beta hydrolase [Pontibacter qinzhouensis]TXK22478.1 alpha/beta hydrolase [Pontibacter qinzhouensis]